MCIADGADSDECADCKYDVKKACTKEVGTDEEEKKEELEDKQEAAPSPKDTKKTTEQDDEGSEGEDFLEAIDNL